MLNIHQNFQSFQKIYVFLYYNKFEFFSQIKYFF